MSKLIRVETLAEAAGCSGSTIRNLVRDGDIPPGMMDGTTRLWPESDFGPMVAVIKLALRKRIEAGNMKREATKAAKAPVTTPTIEPAAPPTVSRALILGSETIVAAVEALEKTINRGDSLRANDAIALRTLVGALVAVAREHNKAAEALLAEFKALRKDMNDAFEAAIEKTPTRNTEHAEAS